MSNITYALPADPTDPNIPELLSYEAKLRVLKTKLEAQFGREMTNEDLGDWLAEYSGNKAEMAKLNFEVLQYEGHMEDAWDKTVEYDAAKAVVDGLFGYHPAGYKTVDEYLRNALQGTQHGDGHSKRLSTLLNVVVPFCVQKDISIPDAAWQPGNRSKFELIAERVPELRAAAKANVEAPEEVEQRIQDMLSKAADPTVTLGSLKADYPVNKRKIELAEAYEYPGSDGRSYMTLVMTNRTQTLRIKGLLEHVCDFHLGTGTEDFSKDMPEEGQRRMEEAKKLADKATEMLTLGKYTDAYETLTKAIEAYHDGKYVDMKGHEDYVWEGMQMVLTILQSANKLPV